jgi:hypothetical protein
MFVHGKNTKVYVNGYDLSDMFRASSIPAASGTAETTTYGKSDKTFIAGLKEATISVEGLFDGTADKVDEVLAPILGASAKSVWTILQGGDVLGGRGVGVDGIETAYEVTSPIEDAVQVTAEAQSSSGRDGIIVHHALAARTSDFDGAGVDGGAASTNGGIGYMHVTDYSGFSSVVIKIQDSADDISYADLLTFSAVSSAPLAERQAVAGTVRQYTRVAIDVTGIGSITLFAGFGRK